MDALALTSDVRHVPGIYLSARPESGLAELSWAFPGPVSSLLITSHSLGLCSRAWRTKRRSKGLLSQGDSNTHSYIALGNMSAVAFLKGIYNVAHASKEKFKNVNVQWVKTFEK